jgi:hypothetical protein
MQENAHKQYEEMRKAIQSMNEKFIMVIEIVKKRT